MKVFSPVVYFILPVLIAAFILVGCSLLFSGCYTLKQGGIMLGYLGRAVPLDTLLEETAALEPLSPEQDGNQSRLSAAEFARRVQDIRCFALEDMGLRETSNYTKYVEIDRDYLAAVVSASAKDSFMRHEWWFPIVGSVPYKGFFNLNDARKERKKLEKRDLDVWIRGVDAFSTLGWFSDPLYSYMRNYSVYGLANLIIHESLHATVFLKNQAQFNEELAEFVGSEGARLYLEKTFGQDSPEYQQAVAADDRDSAAYLEYIRSLIAELETLYASPIPREEKLQKKAEIIRASQTMFDEIYDTLFQSDNYRGFSQLPINNAYLELYRLYHEEAHYFEDLYDRSGRDLPRFISAVKTLKSGEDPRVQLERALGFK